MTRITAIVKICPMHSWKDIVQNYIVKHSDKVRRATSPLRDHLGIGYFTYHRVDSDGGYSVLVDSPEFAELYVEQKLYKEDAFHGLPDRYQPGFYVVENHMSMQPIQKLLRLDSCVMLVQKSGAGISFCGFGGTSSPTSLALNRPETLLAFADYFTKELEPELMCMSQENISLFTLHGTPNFQKKPIKPEMATDSLLAYYQDLGLTNEVLMAKKLSKRERDCLRLLLDGKSAKETARLLGIKRRTVETFFESIKAKLLCWNKQEVFAVAKKLQRLHLLQQTVYE